MLAGYDAWKTRAPEDEAYWYGFDDENAPDGDYCTGWDRKNVTDDQGRELSILVPCACCFQACPDIEDLYERCGASRADDEHQRRMEG